MSLAESRKLRVHKRLDGVACGWCLQPLAFGADAVVCGACAAGHHAPCWDTRAGCSTPGCVDAPLLRLDAVSASQPATPSTPAPPHPGTRPCPGCWNLVSEGAELCGACNAILSPDGVYRGPTVTAPGSVAALVLGIVGTILPFFILSVLAIVYGKQGLDALRFNPRYGGSAMATAGLVLGIVGLCIGLGFVVVMAGADR